jgi:hypothetical protein
MWIVVKLLDNRVEMTVRRSLQTQCQTILKNQYSFDKNLVYLIFILLVLRQN